jgi:ABC-type polysaccharide/polyol phosphate export permease
MAPGLSDLVETCKRFNLVFYMAWSDIRARYKRSVLGPGWITISTAIGVVGMGVIWSYLFKIDRASYVPLLTVGLILWQFFSGCLIESTSVFTKQGNIIRNLSLPLSVHVAQLVLRHIINLLHNLPLFFVISLIFGAPITVISLEAIPGFILDVANLFWIAIAIGIMGARFRDLEYFVTMIMPLMMFVTPVMYRPNALPPIVAKFMWANPLGDMIEIVRYPLLGQSVPLYLIAINIGMLFVGGGLTLMLFNAKRNRIAFWV